MADYPYNGPWQKTIRPTVLKRDRYLCQIRLPGCTIRATHVDHIIPWRQGGPPYNYDNLRAACKHCNETRVHRAGTPPTPTTTPPPLNW